MRLSAPNLIVFMISFIVAAGVVASEFLGARIPVLDQHAFGALLFAYVLLLLGNLVRGM